MFSKKMRRSTTQRPQPRRRSSRNRLIGIEALDSRIVMAANVLSAAIDGTNAGPVEPVATFSAPHITARIVNGTPTSGFPSVGLVGDSRGSFCSGTLISPTHVLTAGHCAIGVGNTQGRFVVERPWVQPGRPTVLGNDQHSRVLSLTRPFQ